MHTNRIQRFWHRLRPSRPDNERLNEIGDEIDRCTGGMIGIYWPEGRIEFLMSGQDVIPACRMNCDIALHLARQLRVLALHLQKAAIALEGGRRE